MTKFEQSVLKLLIVIARSLLTKNHFAGEDAKIIKDVEDSLNKNIEDSLNKKIPGTPLQWK